MRTLLAVASLGLLIGAGVGCGDDTTAPATMDLAVGADMTATPHDMMTLNCSQIISCTLACQGTCAQTCLGEGKAASQTKATSFFTCALGACTTDGGQDAQCLLTTIQGGLQGTGVCGTQGAACTSDQ